MEYIKGNFRKYIFKSDKGYVVGLIKVREASSLYECLKNKTITFTGYFNDLNESDLYIFYGNITNHERYGEQFSVNSYEITLPDDKDNIIEFLSSNLFPGIGEIKAIKIVENLGNDCLDKIMKDKNCLQSVPTMTEKQIDTIYNNLVKYKNSYKIMIELNKYGFNTREALLIFNEYKDETLEIVSSNPYVLIDDIFEMNFKKIEKVRHNFDIKDDDIRRIEFGIKYVMNELSYLTGNTYFSFNEIISYTKKELFIFDEGLVINALEKLLTNKEIIKEDEEKYFLSSMHEAEKYIANTIYYLANTKSDNLITKKDIKELEDFYKIKYDEEQINAITTSLKNKFSVITGGPGTGKTTIIKAICKLYQEKYGLSFDDLAKELALLAPTGRAAKRMSEQTMLPASTIHRFLKWNKEDNTFNINETNKSNVRFVIIDEASMIDTYLLYNLFLGLNKNVKIILIGDYNQLPSVGPGQILKDIIDSEMVDVIKLNKLYRQDEYSNIAQLAFDINENNLNFDIFNQSEDLTFIKTTNEELKDNLKEIILKYKNYDYNKIQVLAPIYKGDNGIDDLNFFIQDLVNEKQDVKKELIANGMLFRENDKVLELVNMIDENVFNGDIGTIIKINSDAKKEIFVDFDTNIVKYTPQNFVNIRHGYAISIHKSQGSEFDIVIIPVINKYNTMLYKKLIYTAITRAKKKLILIGEIEAFKKAILTNREDNRKTNLKKFIISCIK